MSAIASNFAHPVPQTRGISQGFGGQHKGIDFKSKIQGQEGDSVRAFFSGKVVRAEKSDSYGWVVYINHVIDGEHYQSRYAHLRQKPVVVVGQNVNTGSTVGHMGQTGHATGVHLHFEIRKSNNGRPPNIDNSSIPINPLNLLPHN